MAEVLLVEDNDTLAEAVRFNLAGDGHSVTVAATGPAALEAARGADWDVMILDLMLPGIDGFTVLETLRSEGCDVPVLILSARAEEIDRVRGFRAGADQYLTKPFGLLELLERVRQLVRRGWTGEDEALIRFGTVEVDLDRRTVVRAGSSVSLTPRAFDLLVALSSKNGAVVSRLDLLREVWGHRGAVLTRTVDAHVSELRRKLEDNPSDPQHILTVWKIGYRLRR